MPALPGKETSRQSNGLITTEAGKCGPVHHGPSRPPVFPAPADAAQALRPSRQYAAPPTRLEVAPVPHAEHPSHIQALQSQCRLSREFCLRSRRVQVALDPPGRGQARGIRQRHGPGHAATPPDGDRHTDQQEISRLRYRYGRQGILGDDRMRVGDTRANVIGFQVGIVLQNGR